jgi:galactose mutarotase-like enzyme
MSHSRLVTLDDGESRATVYPEQGFQLRGFEVGIGGGQPTRVVFAPAPGEREPADRRYGNPVLFPSVGASHGPQPESWQSGGRTLLMPQHGWARDLYWHVEERDAASVTGVLVPTSAMRAAFPFPFELRLRYALEHGALRLDASLKNTGGDPFPYALGFHPYLLAPLGGGARADCVVQLPAGVRLQSTDSFRTIARSAFASQPVAVSDPQLAGSILLAETGAQVLEVQDRAARLASSVSIEGTDSDFPLWVIWSPSPESPYVCLEPWTDAPNALNRATTRTIPTGATHRYRMTLRVRPL